MGEVVAGFAFAPACQRHDRQESVAFQNMPNKKIPFLLKGKGFLLQLNPNKLVDQHSK